MKITRILYSTNLNKGKLDQLNEQAIRLCAVRTLAWQTYGALAGVKLSGRQIRDWEVIALEIQPDHIHLFVSTPPSISISDVVKILKGSIARKLFSVFPEIKHELYGGSLWSPSYYVGIAGNVSSEIIKHYIERTEHMKGQR